MEIVLGVTSGESLTKSNDIFAAPYDPYAVTEVTLHSLDDEVATPRGQVIVGTPQSVTVDEVTSAAAAGNTGDGTLTLADPAYGEGVKAGVYKVVFVAEDTDLGSFIVEDPDGIIVGTGTVGVAFDGLVKFTVADGTADFIVGDMFNITVAMTATGDGYILLETAEGHDFVASPIAGVVLNEIPAGYEEAQALIITKGRFIKSKLTPSNIPTGVYNLGNIIIDSELTQGV